MPCAVMISKRYQVSTEELFIHSINTVEFFLFEWAKHTLDQSRFSGVRFKTFQEIVSDEHKLWKRRKFIAMQKGEGFTSLTQALPIN